MAHEEVAKTFVVDPVAILTGPGQKVAGEGLPDTPPLEARISRELDETTLRSLRVIHDALNGKIDLGDQDQRARLSLASAVLGAWSRYQQTQTARWSLQMRVQESAARPVNRLPEKAQ